MHFSLCLLLGLIYVELLQLHSHLLIEYFWITYERTKAQKQTRTPDRYTKYDDWVATNPCTLPSKMTLPLLLLKDSGIGNDSDDITNPSAIYASLESNLPKNCLHIEEYRQFLRSGGNASNIRRPLKGRCDHIYFMQSKAIANIMCPRRRVSCMYDAYVSGTVIPLVEANVRSDNGEMGGSEPRLAVLSEVAGSPAPETDPGRRCWIMHKFTEGLHTLLQNFPEAADIINRHRGGLHSAESLLYLIHHIKNINGNLKPGLSCFVFFD